MKYTSLIFILLLIFTSCSNRESADPPPNVLFIGVDDLNDWTGFMGGHPQAITPNLDRLASEGFTFTNAHANCAACQPSRNSLFSGILPSTSGWYSNTFGKGWKRPVYDFIQTVSTPLPQYFRDHGYFTMGAGKLYHYGVSEYPEEINRMWDEAAPEYSISSYFYDSVGHGYGETAIYQPFPYGGSQIIRKYDRKVPGFSLCGGPLVRERDIPEGVMHDEYVARWAVDKLKENHEKPFFLAVGFVRPHVPFTAPEEFFHLYSDSGILIPEVPENDLNDIPVYGRSMIPGIIPAGDHYTVLDMGPDYWQELVQAYLACISFVDSQVGTVLDALDSSPYAGNTIVVLWSDHGQHLGEKKHWRKQALWEESTRIPLIFKLPGTKNYGMNCSRPVSLIDLYPTLVDLCGLPENEALEGNSLLPLLEDPATTWTKPVISFWKYDNISVRSERYRYIRYRDGSEELYDHREDQNEWNNLASYPEYADRLSDHREWIPDTLANPFQLDSIPADDLDQLVRQWIKTGLPGWLE